MIIPEFPADAPPSLRPTAGYVHVPFCAHHCGYCDFAVAVGKDHLQDAYLDALACELNALGHPRPVQTLFVGGGTPSHLTTPRLRRLLALLQAWFNLLPGYEFSLEANPESLGNDKLDLLAEHGVNRLSLGVQSFQPPLLRVLERPHRPVDAVAVVTAARTRIPNLSVDLIFGVPGQTVAQWRDDLRRALDLAPTHVATYGLTYEKGTRLWKQRQRGDVVPLTEDLELAMYETAIDVLTDAGFEHYEISNFARPGFRCRHNQVYWANYAYFGFGVGAASYVGGERRLNVRDLQAYIRRALSGRPTHFQAEVLTPRIRALETVGQQLRRVDGIERKQFQVQTGFALDELLGAALVRNVELGLMADDGRRVALTRRGLCVADAVITDLWRAGTDRPDELLEETAQDIGGDARYAVVHGQATWPAN
ncbi:MAG: radical SAM family heme chaperone HemW [Gemmataceae bacterium]|nr:radical SAM family heme chaperone HemW [Gemmataceae bacterium]